MISEGYRSYSTPRLSPIPISSRPFNVVPVKSSLKPRTEIPEVRPPTRSPARPGRRANDSAIDESGNLPMSSAEIASTIDLLSCLIACARISEPRIPLTAITSTSSATSFVFTCCAKALPENIAAETANDIIAGLKILFVFICVCPIILC